MEFSSGAYHIKRHMKHLKRLMMVHAELTNLIQSLEIDSENWDIIGQKMIPNTIAYAKRCHADHIQVTSFIKLQDIFVL